MHDGPVGPAGELLADVVRGHALEAVDQRGDRQLGRIVDEQVDVVLFAVELAQLGAEAAGDVSHDLFASGEHRVVEHVPPVLRDEDQMNMQVGHYRATSANIRVWIPSW